MYSSEKQEQMKELESLLDWFIQKYSQETEN